MLTTGTRKLFGVFFSTSYRVSTDRNRPDHTESVSGGSPANVTSLPRRLSKLTFYLIFYALVAVPLALCNVIMNARDRGGP